MDFKIVLQNTVNQTIQHVFMYEKFHKEKTQVLTPKSIIGHVWVTRM